MTWALAKLMLTLIQPRAIATAFFSFKTLAPLTPFTAAAAPRFSDPMPQLTRAQFQDRIFHVAQARRIFIDSGVTSSIDAAFEMYLSVFSELNLSASAPLPAAPSSRACPICGLKPLSFTRGCCGRSPSTWSCPRCGYKELS